MNGVRRHDLIALAVLAVVPFALFADVLFAGRSFFLGDFSAYNYPLRSILRTIVETGSFPYWNPYLSGGQPLAANAAYQLFYPPTWLILLPSFRIGLHLLMLVHLALAATGTYVLLRSFRVGRAACFLAALAFGSGGLIVTNIVTSAILFSAAWIPWIAYFTVRFVRTRKRSAFACASLGLAMQFLIGEPITLLQTAILLGLWAIVARRRERGRALLSVAGIGAVGLLLAAIQVLPLLDHLRDTDRGRGIEFKFVAERSTPPVRMLELLVPHPLGDLSPGSHHRWSGLIYHGGAPFYRSIYPSMLFGVLCVAGILARARGHGFFLACIGVSLLLAAGHHTPLLRILYDLGVAAVIRYPEKFLALSVCATIAFGAVVLHQLFRGHAAVRRWAIAVAGLIAGGSALIGAFASTTPFGALFTALFRQPPPLDEVRAIAADHGLRALVLLVLLFLLPRLQMRGRVTAAAMFVVADLLTVTPGMAMRLPQSFYDEPACAERLPRDRASYRIFSLAEWSSKSPNNREYSRRRANSWWIHRNQYLPLRPLTHGFRIALGSDYDLTALATTSDFVRAAGQLAEEHRPGWIGAIAAMSNIHYIAVFRPAKEAFAEAGNDLRRIQPVRFIGGKGQPRYYFSTQVIPLGSRDEFVGHLRRGGYRPDVAFVEGNALTPASGRVRHAEEWTNGARLDVEASGPSFLVMSVTSHKYWRITVDGREVTPLRTNLTYQGVVVPAGRHRVEMRYENPLIQGGGGISIATLLALSLWIKRARTAPGTMRPL